MATPSPAGLGALQGGLARLQALGRARRVAAVASAVWTVLVLAYAIGFFGAAQARGTVFLDGAFFLVTLALPLILIWLAAFLAEELDRQRRMIAALAELVGPLADRLDAARATLERHGPASPTEIARAVQGAVLAGRGTGTELAAPLERILAGQAQLSARLDALFAAAEAPAPPAPRPASQPRARVRPAPAPAEPELPLAAAPDPETPLDWEDLVRAFDFPRDADDAEGFRALRRALTRRSYAQTLQASEDVMTLLSQEGLYMDDLAIAPAEAEAWRRFVAGERGGAADGLGAMRDGAVIETTRALMKADPIFRDAALFFQRRFDAVLGEIAPHVADAELVRFADTRSGRAFQLMARASGSFG